MNAIITGSISNIAQQTGRSIAETFMSADCIVIVDTSGSMAIRDSQGEKSRYDVACEELKHLQNSLPGKIAVLSFSSTTEFCPSGKLTFLGGSTNLAGALKFARVADFPGMRFIVISDGEPDKEREALEEASKYKNKIDTIFVGPEGDQGSDFLKRLAAASGGSAITASQVKELSEKVIRLLGEG